MSKRIGNIESESAVNGFENHWMADGNDSVLFETIGEYIIGWLDIEDVKNDPSFPATKEAASEMVNDNKHKSENKRNKKFITKALSEEEDEKKLAKEILSVKKEIKENNVDEISAEWVKEWHEKDLKTGLNDPKSAEIKDFIRNALISNADEPVVNNNEVSKKNLRRGLFVQYTTLAAAAMFGAFILIKTLLPSSSDPEKLFNIYYKPFNAISPVTRSIKNTETESYFSAIENYNTENYQKAAIGFTRLLEKDTTVVSMNFLLGLSQLGLKNYDKAIKLLATVANTSGEYSKEARWYLGLTYLKTANRQKAVECFENLSRSDGYYRDRSEKILRRLK
jgi:TolA-binding protein